MKVSPVLHLVDPMRVFMSARCAGPRTAAGKRPWRWRAVARSEHRSGKGQQPRGEACAGLQCISSSPPGLPPPDSYTEPVENMRSRPVSTTTARSVSARSSVSFCWRAAWRCPARWPAVVVEGDGGDAVAASRSGRESACGRRPAAGTSGRFGCVAPRPHAATSARRAVSRTKRPIRSMSASGSSSAGCPGRRWARPSAAHRHALPSRR